jgi:hypothetical protein
MTEHLELLLLVAFVTSVTGLLITGVVRLAVRVASRGSPGPPTSDLAPPSLADEGSSASRKEVET